MSQPERSDDAAVVKNKKKGRVMASGERRVAEGGWAAGSGEEEDEGGDYVSEHQTRHGKLSEVEEPDLAAADPLLLLLLLERIPSKE